MPKNRKYVKDYHDIIVQMAAEGKSLTEMTDEIPLSMGAISKYLKNNSIDYHRDCPGGHNYIDLTGKVFGNIIVLSREGCAPDTKVPTWNCKCKCGKEFVARGGDLRGNRTKSCGCRIGWRVNRTNWKGHEEISGGFWRSIVENSQKRSKVLDIDINIEDAWDLFIHQDRKCALSGVPLSFGRSTHDRANQTASLDRIDSDLGYVEGNVQWVHKVLNKMKGTMCASEFIKFCKKVAEYNG
jgi:hypothetical protein